MYGWIIGGWYDLVDRGVWWDDPWALPPNLKVSHPQKWWDSINRALERLYLNIVFIWGGRDCCKNPLLDPPFSLLAALRSLPRRFLRIGPFHSPCSHRCPVCLGQARHGDRELRLESCKWLAKWLAKKKLCAYLLVLGVDLSIYLI